MSGDNRKLMQKEFERDTSIIGEQTDRFLKLIYPNYLIDNEASLNKYLEPDSSLLLDSMKFFRICRCTVENADDLFASVNEKFEKLFTALHSIDVSIGYGIVSRNGTTNLVLCAYSSEDVAAVNNIITGMLSGIELEDYSPEFQRQDNSNKSYGLLTGVPNVFLKEQRQKFSLSSIMRALNGNDYTLLFLAKPVSSEAIKMQICDLIEIKDKAFAVSKRNVSRNSSVTDSDSHTDTLSTSKSHTDSVGSFAGVFIPPFSAGVNYSHAYSRSRSEGYSDTISKAITAGETIAADIQNSFALELMNYAGTSIERLKGSQNNGVWQTAICYSANSKLTRNIIKACLCGELSKPDANKLSMLAFEPVSNTSDNQGLLLPKFLRENTTEQNPLCSYINSSELGLLCTIPTDSVPDFELRTAKQFPLLKSDDADAIIIGQVADGKRLLENMPFGLTSADLNKHTFICGITGSGKTTTVKKILVGAKKPFLVIESAKKEYRNIPLDTITYTLGKPEINCPQINPFYIMPGVSPQSHIDFLKDLFMASFSFYGPMPYILEKCLHNVYKNKGWNLTLGYHPLLANMKSSIDFFDISYTRKQYAQSTHRYLFPTMQELKDEIERYIKDEMDYDGEVAGNIKTAIKIRLENLCVGSKGYMFNTYEYLDMSELLEQNAVFELEGLADDSDKAFCVGLMVIFISEYRQTVKETRGNQKTELLHLLVIEEAHRLLKNVDTERSSEGVGNPKGKAVEHFTNMIAEMRSYGQGVIVAEQIPSKLAPDVIKNSSNKIIQRIVSADDQQIIANTIGVPVEDSIQLGRLETGFALCHKEGMSLPVATKIGFVNDDFVSDEILYNCNVRERMNQIAVYTIREVLYEDGVTKELAFGFLNTLLVETSELTTLAAEQLKEQLVSLVKRHGIHYFSIGELHNGVAIVAVDIILNFLIRGVYAVETLPDENIAIQLHDFMIAPSKETANELKQQMNRLYGQSTILLGKRIVGDLVKLKLTPTMDGSLLIRNHFARVSDQTVSEIFLTVKEVR